MFTIPLAIAPIFVLIATGYGLRRAGLPSAEFWNLNDRLVYLVLMPAIFFDSISTADLGAAALGGFSALLYAGFFVGIIAGLSGAGLMRHHGRAAGSSLVQGAGRFNTFIALAVAGALYGPEGLELAILGAAILVPVVNLTVVTTLVLMLPQERGTGIGGQITATLKNLAKNPLILSIAAALAWNLAGLPRVPVFHGSLEILGQAALPIMLLCVGANLKLRGLSAEAGPLFLAATAKLGLFPAAIMGLALILDVPPLQAQIALTFGALPTGVAAYTLARQMGGDAPLMAAMITVQTLLSFATMPLWLSLGERVFGL